MSGDRDEKLWARPNCMVNLPLPYCPGCSHGVLHRLVCQAIDDLDLRHRTIGIASVGCSVRMWRCFDCDMAQALHGRAPAVATGLKRSLPDRIVWTIQGDGDLASIGMEHIVHAANRGERITVFYLNNACYGATGGQMAPTTLAGQKTTTTPDGRDPALTGYPIRMSELLAGLPAPAYIVRVALSDTKRIREAQRAVRKALEVQIAGAGFSMVEALGVCPTNLHLTPVESIAWLEENMIPYYPLGELRTPESAPR